MPNNTKCIKGCRYRCLSCHYVLLFMILMIVWGIASFCYYRENFSVFWGVVPPIIVYVLFAYLSTYLLYRHCLNNATSENMEEKEKEEEEVKKKEEEKKKENCIVIKKIFFILASPSWSIAKLFKKRIENRLNGNDKDIRCKKTCFITGKNALNMVTSILLGVFVFLFFGKWHLERYFLLIMSIIVLRTLSRSFEITFAFGKDAIDCKKSSNLQAHERLILAFTSLFECIINYSVAYYLVGLTSDETICKWQACVHSFQSALFYDNEILSRSLHSSFPTALSMLQVTQVITCITLVIIAFAMYMSENTGDNNETKK